MESRHDSRWDNLANEIADELGLSADDEIPTPRDIASALFEAQPWMQTAKEECGHHIAAAYVDAEPPPGAMTYQERGGPPRAAMIGVMMGAPEGEYSKPVNVTALIYDAEMTSQQNTEGETIYHIGNMVATLPDAETILALGKDLLAPLIKAWLQHCKPDRRKTAIVPETLATFHLTQEPTTQLDRSDSEEISAYTGFQARPSEQAYLPNLVLPEDALIPWLPLYYIDAHIRKKRNKGTPYVARIFLEAVLAVPTGSRNGRRTLDVEFGEIVKSENSWLFPNGRYAQARYPDVEDALKQVHNMRFPWAGEDGSGGRWATVVVRNIPRAWNAYQDKVIFEIAYPPGVNNRGPLVYKPALRILAQQSVLRWRAMLALYYLWDRYGRLNSRYIQPTRPKLARNAEDQLIGKDEDVLTTKDGVPIRQYMIGSGDKRRLRPGVIALDPAGNRVFDIRKAARERNPAANAYRILTPDQVMEVAFGPAEKRLPQTTIRKRRLDALNAVRHLADANYCSIEEVGGGYRILPPYGWGARFDP